MKTKFLFFLLLAFSFGFGQTTITLDNPGAGTWTVPAGVTSIKVEVWGGGGGGQAAKGAAGGGGSGGNYVRKNAISVIPGTTYNIFVGSGGASGSNGAASWFSSNATLLAAGGVGAAGTATSDYNSSGANFNPASNNVGGDVSKRGGKGAKGSKDSYSGGSGASGGDNDGLDAIGKNAGGVASNSYAGANGRNNDGVGSMPASYAGGGSGAYSTFNLRDGGKGGNGLIKITYAGYCTPGATIGGSSINNVSFVGTLIPDSSNSTDYSAGGFGDHTALTDRAKQIPGGIVTVKVANAAAYYMAAYVDWNNDKDFTDSGEQVYNSGTYKTQNALFGFKVPAGTAPGLYRIRVRSTLDGTITDPCATFSKGETEDYLFQVIPDALAKIAGVTNGERCGTGTVTLSATSTGGSSYNWYTTRFGGSPISGATSSSYTTPSLSTTTTYYVTAISGTSESVYRTPVTATINPIPTISITSDVPAVCGVDAQMKVTASGDHQEEELLNEKFSTGLGLFKQVDVDNSLLHSKWTSRDEAFETTRPPYKALSLFVSSGNAGGKYACSVTDLAQTSSIKNRLELTNSKDATGVEHIFIDFDLFYQPYISGNASKSYLRLEASKDGGVSWETVANYTAPIGNPVIWGNQSILLDASYNNTSQLKIRFEMFSYGAYGPSWDGDIAAIDNVRVYGKKNVNANFAWTSSASGILFNADCATPYSGASGEVCIKPDAASLEAPIVLTTAATLANGCTVSSTYAVTNNTKIWNPTSGDNWNSADWKPDGVVPDETKCVVIRKPLKMPGAIYAKVKTLTIQDSGTLTIESGNSLTVQDFIKNTKNAGDFVVKDGANLVQINDTPTRANVGQITVENKFIFSSERKQYNYVISPVINQNLKTIYPGNPEVIYHSENANWFYNSAGAYVPGRALAVKEPVTTAVPTATATAEYKGEPFNGILDYPLAWTNTNPKSGTEHGWNLVGNPYPSNLDIKKLYDNNSGKIDSDIKFWDSRGNTIYEQHGSNYGTATINNYANFNAVSGSNGTGTAATSSVGAAKVPTKLVKVGVGFMVKALHTADGQNLHFENSYRATSAAVDFHGKNTNTVDDRFWLTLQTPNGLEAMTAIVYFANGNNALAIDDTKSNGASDDIYTILDENKLAIQGKAPFVKSDVLPLGINAFASGEHTIHLFNKEGVFADGQSIYLKDNQLNILTDITAGDYKFTTEAGTIDSRFEIVYESEAVLGTSITIKPELEVFKDLNDFVVTSTSKSLLSVEMYDAVGRLVNQLKGNAKEFRIPASQLVNGIYLLKIELADGSISVKKIRK